MLPSLSPFFPALKDFETDVVLPSQPPRQPPRSQPSRPPRNLQEAQQQLRQPQQRPPPQQQKLPQAAPPEHPRMPGEAQEARPRGRAVRSAEGSTNAAAGHAKDLQDPDAALPFTRPFSSMRGPWLQK
jgi:hypothetical protein